MATINKALYPDDWQEIASAVKETAGWRCQNCGHHHDPGHGYTLTVHHIDLDPSNCQLWNLAALCQRCHLHWQKPLNLRQFSMFGLPEWLKPFFDAVGSKSSIPGHVFSGILSSPVTSSGRKRNPVSRQRDG